MEQRQVGVIGTGAWGTAIALALARAGTTTWLHGRNHQVLTHIEHHRKHPHYFPTVILPSAIRPCASLQEMVNLPVLFMVTPAQSLRAQLYQLKAEGLSSSTVLVLCAKGIEQRTLLLQSEIVTEILPGHPHAILSGPNLAHEVADHLPAISTIAAQNESILHLIMSLLASATFRLYPTRDMVSVQVAGAVKNVIAIACGIAKGKKLGDNALAALITRGLQEISKIALAKGGQQETLFSPAGVGDLVLTCQSITSRNMSLGLKLGEGQALEDILAARQGVTEGIATSQAVTALATHLILDLPICQGIFSVLHQGLSVDDAIDNLLMRPQSSMQ